MRRIAAVLVMIAAVGLCNVGIAADEAKRADILRLMEVSGELQTMRDAMTVVIGQLRESGANLPDAYWDEFESVLKTDELPNILVQVYDKYYTHEQITSLIELYKSPVGQMLVEKQRFIQADSMYVGQQWASRKSAEIMKRVLPMGNDPGTAAPKE
jgi:hypothetical protein